MASVQFTGLFGPSVQTYTVLLGGSSRPASGGPLLAPACLLLAARGRRSASPVTGPFSKGQGVSQIRLGTTQSILNPPSGLLLHLVLAARIYTWGLRCRPPPSGEG